MKVHFIAIGGSAMHNMALALHHKGYLVSGSDDEILEPSKSRLAKYGLLPATIGWYPEKITQDIDAVILGMHARANNPELLKAQELGLKIYSYPEYIYECTKDKIRVVVGGSHGKTTITSMILHVLKHANIACDFMVGAQLQGFDTMVKLTNEAKIAIIEGDEYLASPIDRRPKFHLYHPDVAIISGIAWDHINVFPTFENYVDQFKIFIDKITPAGTLIYCQDDLELKKIVEEQKNKIYCIAYALPAYSIINGETIITDELHKYTLKVFGKHNLYNLNAARLVCNKLGVDNSGFYSAMQSFEGAAKRLELVKQSASYTFYKDFAHSPSKVKATIDAVKEQFPTRKLIACLELHTFSSLNETFLNEYKDSMEKADEAIVYFNPDVIEHKKLTPITAEQVAIAFAGKEWQAKNLQIFTESNNLVNKLKEVTNWKETNLLMMSSGNFDGIDFKQLATELFQ